MTTDKIMALILLGIFEIIINELKNNQLNLLKLVKIRQSPAHPAFRLFGHFRAKQDLSAFSPRPSERVRCHAETNEQALHDRGIHGERR